MDIDFTLEGNQRSDGLVRFTCDDLPGFRLLLKAREDKSAYNADIKSALMAFVPLFFAAEARSKSIGIQHKDGSRDGNRGQAFEVVASFTT